MPIRRQSVETLQKILEEKTFFSSLKSELNEKDLPFANMLILTVLRRLRAIEQILQKFISHKIPDKVKVIHYVLLCGAAEILYMETPDYAVINEYVEIAKKSADKFAAGMVNAVLRKIAADKENLGAESKISPLTSNFRQILKGYSRDDVAKIEKMLSTEPPLDLTIKNQPREWAEKLNGVLMANGTVRIIEPKVKIPLLPGYAEGQWWVQDLAASLPVKLLGDISGKKVLDLCAAPGGKTAQLLAAGAMVNAVDVDEERLKRLRQNITRLGLEKNLKVCQSEGVEYLQKIDEYFDIIVIDAPCSATGTFRRHPEVVHIKSPQDVKRQIGIQRKMLKTAAVKLKKSGILLYCTCSIAQDEGMRQVEWFLQNMPEFELFPFEINCLNPYAGQKLPTKILAGGVLRTMPFDMNHWGGMDAFFAAAFIKK